MSISSRRASGPGPLARRSFGATEPTEPSARWLAAESLVQARTLLQAGLFLAVAVGLGYAVVATVDHWSDWVVFAVLVMTALGAAIAVHRRQYPTKKRTFVRHSDRSRY